MRMSVVLALIASFALLASPAALGGETPADVRASTYASANTFVVVADPASQCIKTAAAVTLFSSIGNEGPIGAPDTGSPQTGFVDVSIVKYDQCTGALLSHSYGQATIDRSHFDFLGNGTAGATVTATVSICDRDEQLGCIEGTTRTVAVDMAWSGVGDVFRSPASPPGMNLAPGVYLQLYHGHGMARWALATGSVVDGATTTSFNSAGGVLFSFRENDLSIFVGPPWQRP